MGYPILRSDRFEIFAVSDSNSKSEPIQRELGEQG